MMNNKFRGGLLGLKDFKMILRVTAAQVKHIEYLMLNASPLKYCFRESKTSRHVKRGRDTKIPQSSGPPIKFGDEVVHKELGDRIERAATTASSLEAEQDSGSDPRCQDTILGGVDAQTRHHLVLPVQVPAAEATQDEGIDSGIPTDSQQTPITAQHSSLDLRRKRLGEKGGKMNFLKMKNTSWIDSVLDLEKAKDAQAKEIVGLKKRVQKLESKKKSRTTRLQRLRKVSESSRVESSETKESLGAQEDASKQGRIKIVDETQGRLDDAKMFDTNDLHGDEVIVDMAVGEKQEKSAKIDEREVSTGVEDSVAPTIPVTTADEGVTAAKIDEITPTSAPTIVIDELTLAQTLIKSSSNRSYYYCATTKLQAREDQVARVEEMARKLEA
ncbi:hypothetical protein Tco_0231877 [Tanacetum coccineum]